MQLVSGMLEMAPGVLEEAACAASFPIAPRFDNTEDEIERRLQTYGILRHTPFPSKQLHNAILIHSRTIKPYLWPVP